MDWLTEVLYVVWDRLYLGFPGRISGDPTGARDAAFRGFRVCGGRHGVREAWLGFWPAAPQVGGALWLVCYGDPSSELEAGFGTRRRFRNSDSNGPFQAFEFTVPPPDTTRSADAAADRLLTDLRTAVDLVTGFSRSSGAAWPGAR